MASLTEQTFSFKKNIMQKKPRKLFYHLFDGHRYLVCETPSGVRDRLGQCDNPAAKCKMLEIPIGRAPLFLQVTLHESLHACFWQLDEESIDSAAASIAGLLWRLGWRNVSVPKSEGGEL
jgi:hypothetical protein